MKTGFSFNGVHAYDIDGVAAVSTDDRPIVPDVKETTFSPLNRDGVYDFSAANPDGRGYYEERIFQLKIKVKAADFATLQRTLTHLSRWLRGRGDLIFDDTPNVKWAARIVEAVPYAPEREGRKAELDVKYRVQPFARLFFDTMDGPPIDWDAPIDTPFPIGINEYFTFTVGGAQTVINIGDVPVRPVITVTGTSQEIGIRCNGHLLRIPADAWLGYEKCVIDCEKCMVTGVRANGETNNLMTRVIGEFFELHEGDNDLWINMVNAFTLEVRYTPKYMYNVDLQEMGFE